MNSPTQNGVFTTWCSLAARTQTRRAGGRRRADCLHVEPEVHDVAVLDDVVLALDAELAGRLAAGLATELDVVLVAGNLGLDDDYALLGQLTGLVTQRLARLQEVYDALVPSGHHAVGLAD